MTKCKVLDVREVKEIRVHTYSGCNNSTEYDFYNRRTVVIIYEDLENRERRRLEIGDTFTQREDSNCLECDNSWENTDASVIVPGDIVIVDGKNISLYKEI